jgi:hypothetical protein
LYLKHQPNLNADRIIINFISKSQSKNGNHPILKNPTYQLAYKELTLEEPAEIAKSKKVKVFCEDKVAIHFAKCLIKSKEILSLAEFHSSLNPASNNPGTSYSSLSAICIKYPLLLEHSLVIFDADVGTDVTRKIPDKNSFLVLPDPNGVALERRIIYYIMSLDNNDTFFVNFKKERDSFLNDFSKSAISLTPTDVLNEEIVTITQCKNWVESNPTEFKKYVTHYCSTKPDLSVFANEFLLKLNKINIARGLPSVNL